MSAMRFRPFPRSSRSGGRVLFWLAVAGLGAEVAAFGLRASELKVSTTATAAQAAAPAAMSTPTSSTVTSTTGAAVDQPPASTAVTDIGSPVQRPGSATYTLPAGTPLTVTATADCWVEARTGAGGKLISARTLLAGDTEQFVSPVWIRFGNPNSVKVPVGGVVLRMTPDAPGDLVAQA